MAKGKKLFKLLRRDDNSSEELIEVVNESHEKGVLNTNEADMIQNIVELRNKDAKDVMVHRKNVVALDGKMTIKETLSQWGASHAH